MKNVGYPARVRVPKKKMAEGWGFGGKERRQIQTFQAKNKPPTHPKGVCKGR